MDITRTVFVLIHSPLVGPSTWKLVGEELQKRGMAVLLPALQDNDDSPMSYWQQHAESVANALASIPSDQPVVIVGHSGAGPLLPAVADAVRQPVAAYLFVDAGIPSDGASRLDMLSEELPEIVTDVQMALEAGQRIPTWTEDDLAEILPDSERRQLVLSELHPRGLAFYTEPIPVFDGWPDAPCGYLQFSPAYDYSVEQAREEGFYVRELKGGHFHMLVEPAAVVDVLIDMLRHMM